MYTNDDELDDLNKKYHRRLVTWYSDFMF